ncbi:MAG TPA: GNAT family N-acetyltransferase [Croceicoccus sp.]|nr:GNAT family N-acetyltransferase [Croceicoccus sp.]
MADPVATTERLVLRPWREEDYADWSRHLNTAQVRAHIGGQLPAERARSTFERLLTTWPTKGYGMIAMVRRRDDMLLGACGCGPMTDHATPAEMRGGYDIGYQLRVDMWGRGYATEAAGAALDLIFDRMGQDVAWGRTSEANAASGAVFRRLGMTLRPDLDYDDPDYEPAENPTQVWMMRREDRP